MDINPYEPPRELEPEEEESAKGSPLHQQILTDAQIRRKYIDHEAAIQWTGMLFVCVGVCNLCGMVVCELLQQRAGGNPWQGYFGIALAGMLASLLLAAELIKLNSWAQPFAVFVAILGIAVPFGILICPYIVYLLLSQRGRVVFTPEYKKVVAATFHIKYRPSWGIWLSQFFS